MQASMTNVRAGTPVIWGAPRIHGELLKLAFVVAQSTVAKYMAKTDGSPSGQSWGIFLRNHMPHIAALDLFVLRARCSAGTFWSGPLWTVARENVNWVVRGGVQMFESIARWANPDFRTFFFWREAQ